jgi:predicted membrane chloride channel (bestrophin family)
LKEHEEVRKQIEESIKENEEIVKQIEKSKKENEEIMQKMNNFLRIKELEKEINHIKNKKIDYKKSNK